MLLKFILFAFLIYWAGKMIAHYFSGEQNSQTRVNNKSDDNKPLDLSHYDVEDVDFEDLDE